MIAKLQKIHKNLAHDYGIIFVRQAALSQSITEMEEEMEQAIAGGEVDGLDPSLAAAIDDAISKNDVYEDFLDDTEELMEAIQEAIDFLKPAVPNLLDQGTKMELRYQRIIDQFS